MMFSQYDQVISPMDSIKPIEKHAGWTEERVEKYNEERIYSIINSGWDLIIIDEAHRVAGSSGEVARYKLGYLLSQASPYLLLLSATPHNGKTEPFLRLVRLLDEEAFPNSKSILKEQVAPYLIRTEKREAIDNNGNLLLRPMAGKRLMDVFLDGNSCLTIGSVPNVTETEYQELEKISMDFAYNTFIELKEKQIQLNQERYNKYMYALKLREDAATHIGIDNIRRSRLAKLAREKRNYRSYI